MTPPPVRVQGPESPNTKGSTVITAVKKETLQRGKGCGSGESAKREFSDKSMGEHLPLAASLGKGRYIKKKGQLKQIRGEGSKMCTIQWIVWEKFQKTKKVPDLDRNKVSRNAEKIGINAEKRDRRAINQRGREGKKI